jgi:hypothetical protein
MKGKDVVTSDDHKLGTVVAERDDCAIVEMGHVFKAKHAIPNEFLHEHEGVLRATVAKEIVEGSPKVDDDHFDANSVKLYYGVIEVHVVDPDPNELNADNERTAGDFEERAPAQRVDEMLGGGVDVDRTTNSADPSWSREDRR